MEEKKKKKYNFAVVWLVLAVISFVILVGMIFSHINEWSAIKLGHKIVAEYHEDDTGIYANYYDEEGNLYTFNLISYYPVHDGDHVNLYYLTNINEAQPANTLISWVRNYIIFGAVFAVSIWRLQKNNPKNIYK